MNTASLLVFWTRALLFLIIGFTTVIIGYPISRLCRPQVKIIEVSILGSWAIVLLVYLTGIFELQFNLYVIPFFFTFLAVCIILLIRRETWHVSYQEQGHIYLMLMSVLAIISRLLQVQSLYLPNWLDGITHYKIVLNILAKGFISPDRIYHAGFHSLAAFLSILLPIFSLPEILLMLGQWLSFLAGLSIFLLIRAINPHKSVALIATAFVWFFAPFPSYLVSWSRYPLLAGLVFFPLAFITIQEWINNDKATKSFLFVVTAGSILFLTHYYIFFIWACCLLLQWLHYKHGYPLFWQLIVIAIVTLILIGWRIPTFAQYFTTSLSLPFTDALDLGEVLFAFKLLFKNGGWILWLLLPMGLWVLSTLQRNQLLKVIIIISLGACFEIVQNSLSETRPSGIQNTIIFSTFPIVYGAAIGIQQFAKFIEGKISLKPFIRVIKTGVVILIVIIGADNISFGLINPNTILFNVSDQDAFQWIENHTEANDIIAIAANSWDGNSQGCDGGSWLPYLTGHQIILMESAFDPISSPAHYLYKGGCQDPLYQIERGTTLVNVVYQNNDVTIFYILK